jgi:hypothetical protein
MLLHLPIVIMATLSPVAVSDTVPNFDIVKECRFEGGSSVEYDHCSGDESTALRTLVQGWAKFAGADKRNCVAMTTVGGFTSYVELLTCLEMARDSNGVDDNTSLSPQATDRVQPAGSGVTVGIGHGPVSPGGR